MAKHNKKRNVGLIHDQLVRYASEKLIEGDEDRTDTALEIIRKNFQKNSELFLEFRLFNSLIHTRVPSRDIARKIIDESRIACRNHDAKKLRSEKSSLIRDVNHHLNDKDFYNKKSPEYRVFSTVQALLNEWRGASKLSPAEVVAYESGLENWLIREQSRDTLHKTVNANPLTLNIMMDKFNKKYSSVLNEQQAKLLEHCLSGDNDLIVEQLHRIKTSAKTALASFYNKCNNKVLNEKRDLVTDRIEKLQLMPTEISISKALVLSELISELESEDE